MNISASQAQLLRQLNIKPLDSRAGFFSDAVMQTDTIVSAPANLLQPEETLLSSDIKRLLAQTPIKNWLIDPAVSHCATSENGSSLITPALSALQDPTVKRQLWGLLINLLADDAD